MTLYTLALANFAANLFMLGLIWFVQIVHYPLFASTGRADFARYQSRHASLTTLVVAPPMFVELFATFALVAMAHGKLPHSATLSSAVLVAAIWGSTAFLQVPCHNALQNGFDEATHRFLVNSNWIRTVAWTAKAALSSYLLWKARELP